MGNLPSPGPRVHNRGQSAERRLPRRKELDNGRTLIPLENLESNGTPPKMTQEEFIFQAGARCPHCGSLQVTGGGLSSRVGATIQAVWGCETCGSEWIATYALSGFISGQMRNTK